MLITHYNGYRIMKASVFKLVLYDYTILFATCSPGRGRSTAPPFLLQTKFRTFTSRPVLLLIVTLRKRSSSHCNSGTNRNTTWKGNGEKVATHRWFKFSSGTELLSVMLIRLDLIIGDCWALAEDCALLSAIGVQNVEHRKNWKVVRSAWLIVKKKKS